MIPDPEGSRFRMELRGRIMKCVGIVIVFSIAAGFFTTTIIDFFARPLPTKELIFLHPTDAFQIRHVTRIQGLARA